MNRHICAPGVVPGVQLCPSVVDVVGQRRVVIADERHVVVGRETRVVNDERLGHHVAFLLVPVKSEDCDFVVTRTDVSSIDWSKFKIMNSLQQECLL